MEFQSFLLSLSLFGIIFANENKTRCYEDYCYTMINEGVLYSSISNCSPPYQYLEIYNMEMMNDVIKFAREIKSRMNYVELRLDCTPHACHWRDSNTRAEFKNWYGEHFEDVEPNTVLVFLLNLRYDWFYYSPQEIMFSTICMKPIRREVKHSDSNPTSDVNIRLNPTKTRAEVVEVSNAPWNATRSKDCVMGHLIILVVSGAFHVMALATIIVLIASRKRGHSHSIKRVPSKKKDLENESQCEKVKVESNCERPDNAYHSFAHEDELCDYANLNQVKKQ